MNIPTRLELGGISITVEVDTTMHQRLHMIGEAQYGTQKIVIDPSVAPAETTEQAFWHELIHWILFIMNEDKLRNHEKFVDVFAHLLYQAVKSGGIAGHSGRGDNVLQAVISHREEPALEQYTSAKRAMLPILEPEPQLSLTTNILEYAVWLQDAIGSISRSGDCPCKREAFKKIETLVGIEIQRLEGELLRNVFD